MFHNVKDSIFSSMRQGIRNLSLLPGAVISETEVSTRYDVSRTPVREAFIRLADEALIKVVPQKETTVSLIDLDRVRQEHFLRVQLELSVLKPFIERRSVEQHIVIMKTYIEMQIAALQRKEWVNFMTYDDIFHNMIFQGAGQELSGKLINSTSGHYYRIRMLSIWLNGVAEDVVSQHELLLQALEKQDLEAAQAVLCKHLSKLNFEEQLLLKEYPSYFLT
ncbi:MAG: GntR family transcriptional regulator [Deferribacteraceae bacterium]|jgi:DNA-binding GntR family transcriptional regulator|nr:GntR family transcriptional regulator [Deferribacteraceae bacterium]